MIGMLLSLLAFLISPFGMLALLVGLVLFLLMPLVPRVTNELHGMSRAHLQVATRMLQRATIVVSEHGDLILKRMSPDDIGTERIAFDNDTKEFEDQHNRQAKSWWNGIPFALADEVHGFLFTPEDAALGARKADAERGDGMVHKATASEREMYEDVLGWVRGVFEFDEGKYELVDLNKVRQLVTGSERAEDPQRVKSFYELSREPYQSGTSTLQWIAIIIAVIGPFAAIWVLSDQFGLTGVDRSISYSIAGIFSLKSIYGINWRRIIAGTVVFGWIPVALGAIAYFVSTFHAIGLAIALVIGFFVVPLAMELLKISDTITNKFSGLFLKTGLIGYREPVFEHTDRGYRVREFSKLDTNDNVVWHNFLGRRFGFTWTPTKDAWGNSVAERDYVESRTVESASSTNIPPGYNIIPERIRAAYGAFIPKRVKDSKIYVRTGTAMARMKGVACGNKSHKRLTHAKEKFGGGGGVSETSLMYAITLSAMFSFIAGLLVFVVPVMLA